jgi:hypothetical protein
MSDGRAVVVPPVALSGWDDEDDDDNFGGDRADDYDLQELIESEITLDSWVDALGVGSRTWGSPSATTRYALHRLR